MILIISSTTNDDILRDWAEIKGTANEILGPGAGTPTRQRVSLAGKSRIFTICVKRTMKISD